MSSDHFHVHGPHDHAVEHAGQGGHGSHGGHGAHGGQDRFASRIAAMTAILATLGALFSYEGGRTQNDALMHKNEAAIQKTEAANQWSYYQAKSAKQNLSELAQALTAGETRAHYAAEVERYGREKLEIKDKAEALEARAKAAEELSEAALHEHHRWAQAMTALQVAISLAAITLLTRRRWLQWTSLGVAVAGCVVGVLALLHV